MSARSRLVLPLVLIGSLTACGDDDSPGSATTGTTGVGPTTTTTGSTGAADVSSGGDTGSGTDTAATADSTTGTPACPDTHACVRRAPEGWSGPSIHLRGPADEMASACPPAYPDADVMGGSDLVAPAASCDCACASASGVTCELQATLRFHGADSTCSSPNPASFQFFTTLCNVLPQVFQANSWWVVDPVKVTGGSCMPQATVEVEPPLFATAGTLCGGAELLDATCDTNRVCAPAVDGAEICIWQVGEADCPATYDDVRYLYHTEIVDDRGCAACSCDDPVGLCDDASMLMFQNVCNPPVAGYLPADGECHGTVPTSQSVVFDPGTPSAFCEPSTPAPTGEAIGATPFTVCCNR